MDQVVIRDSDLRACLQGLEEAGELQRINSEVDPCLTVGAISQRLAEQGGPATHFENVQGAGHGITLVSGVLGRGVLGSMVQICDRTRHGPEIRVSGNPRRSYSPCRIPNSPSSG